MASHIKRSLTLAMAMQCGWLTIVHAHHSYAMFDTEKISNATGTVRVWEFTNPHAMLWVYINDANDKPILWGLEAPGPSQLLNGGWDKETVKPGDKVSVSFNPLRDGRNGGSLQKVTLADGRTLATAPPPPTSPSATPRAIDNSPSAGATP